MKTKKQKLAPFERKVVKALEHIFSVGGWEIPDACIAGRVTSKVRELESRINALDNKSPVQRIDAIAAMKGGLR